MGVFRPRPAYASAYLETSASASQILDWYEHQLRQEGWQVRIRLGGTLVGYTRGTRENFDVEVYGSHPPGDVLFDGKGNVYDIYYQVRPAG